MKRHYKLTNTANTKMHRAGIEFLDYNLASLRYPGWDKMVPSKDKDLREWLHFFAEAQTHSLQDVKRNVGSQSVQKAYHMIESATLPQKVKKAYDEDRKKRYNISHYVQNQVKKGKAEGRAEGEAEGEFQKAREVAKALMAADMDDSFIVKTTGLTLDQVEALRKGAV